jgi:hypothetical protein
VEDNPIDKLRPANINNFTFLAAAGLLSGYIAGMGF